MTIKTKIIVYLIFSLITIVGLLATISYRDFSHSSVQNATKLLTEEATAGATAIEQKMEVYFRGLELAAHLYQPSRVDSSTSAAEMKNDINILKGLQEKSGALESYSGHANGITYTNQREDSPIPNFNAKELQREWYLRIFSGEKRLITKPYQSSTGDTVMALAVPVVKDGKVAATMNINLKLDSIKQFTDSLFDTNQFDLTRPDGYIIAGDSEWIGKNQFERHPELEQFNNSNNGIGIVNIDGEKAQIAYSTIPGLGWKVWRYERSADIYVDSQKNLKKVAFVGILCFIISIVVIGYIISRSLEPLSQLKSTLGDLASGNGDLTQRLPVKGNDEISQISQEVNRFISNIHSIITEIKDSSQTISGSVIQLGDFNSKNDSMLCKHGHETDQVATAIEEMRIKAATVSENASTAAELTSQTNHNVHESKRAIASSNQTIEKLITDVKSVSSQITEINSEINNITDVLNMIGEIAEQTNLLALNAAIEAARAGEQGRGFAVVADEVRALAARTQSCTGEIEKTLGRLQSSSNEAIGAAESSQATCEQTSESVVIINKELDTIIQSVEEMNGLNNVIASSVEEQSSVTNEIADNISHIHDIVAELVNSSKFTIDETDKLTSSNQRLDVIVNKFKL